MENDKMTAVEETVTPTVPEAAVEAVPEAETAAPAAVSAEAASVTMEEVPANETEAEPVTPTPSEVNAANAALSTGKVTDDGQGAAFFTAADVRAMSREQVRRNLAKILKSMESPEF